MNCCINCFDDEEIRSIISRNNNMGTCDFCGTEETSTYDVFSTPNPIADGLIDIISIYDISTHQRAKPLKRALYDDWDIFACGSETMLLLIKKLCRSAYPEESEMFSSDVAIPRFSDEKHLQEISIVGGKTWQGFSEYVKYKNRFHASVFNSKVFEKYLKSAEREYRKDTIMYRARIAPNEIGFSAEKMYAPPPKKSKSSRANPEGIGALYLSRDKKTVLREVRASIHDFVSIGSFRLKRDISIINLTEISRASPFLFAEDSEDLELYAANRKVLQEIAAEIAKPLRSNDSPLEYLPTQFITEFIKSKGYDGVEYASTLIEDGYNLAIFIGDDSGSIIFGEEFFECIGVETVEVSKVEYDTFPPL